MTVQVYPGPAIRAQIALNELHFAGKQVLDRRGLTAALVSLSSTRDPQSEVDLQSSSEQEVYLDMSRERSLPHAMDLLTDPTVPGSKIHSS